MAGGSCRGLLDYKTAKFALTRNWRVGLLHRLLQLGVLGYLLGWVLLVRKGYQDTDRAPRAAVVTKLKGAAAAEVRGAGRRLWDAADYAHPAQGGNVLFLVTNFIATAGQAQGTCPESPSVPAGMCTEDADCPMGEPVVHGNGIKTGKCVMFNTTHSTCEIYGWCPVENNTLSRKPLLAEAENFTLFIRNTVHFTKFNFSREGASEFALSGTVTWIALLPTASLSTPSACRTGGTISELPPTTGTPSNGSTGPCSSSMGSALTSPCTGRPRWSVTWFCSTWMQRLTSIGRRSLRRQTPPKVRVKLQLRAIGYTPPGTLCSRATWGRCDGDVAAGGLDLHWCVCVCCWAGALPALEPHLHQQKFLAPGV
ncbi:P2X purinoceptor 6 isoform X2 [Lathamus discolor]|uniref:P2X purinoceptor 6 isoform X2 n=1 Tax=Lathamus discolor TaxID=678569 RepID=UPI0032B7DE19